MRWGPQLRRVDPHCPSTSLQDTTEGTMNANDVASEGLGLISRLADEARSVAMVAGYVALPSSSGGPCSTWRARRGDGCRRSDRGRANRRREGTEQRRRFASLSWPCHPADAMARLKAPVPITPETTVLPEQFRLQAKTDAFLPAKRLMVAVLERALGEYETYAARTDWRERRQFAEVEAWFASDDTGWPFSFVPICEARGLATLVGVARHTLAGLLPGRAAQASASQPSRGAKRPHANLLIRRCPVAVQRRGPSP